MKRPIFILLRQVPGDWVELGRVNTQGGARRACNLRREADAAMGLEFTYGWKMVGDPPEQPPSRINPRKQ
jgi:hypothetical protein